MDYIYIGLSTIAFITMSFILLRDKTPSSKCKICGRSIQDDGLYSCLRCWLKVNL